MTDTGIYVLVGFVVAAFLHVWLGAGRALRFLSKRSTRSVALATAVGAPLPLCSCSVLPAALTLRRNGASKGATLSFLVSTPETSVSSVLLTWSLMGPVFAVVRPIASIITALGAGLVQNFVERDTPTAPPSSNFDPQRAPAAANTASCCESPASNADPGAKPVQLNVASCCAPEPEPATQPKNCCAPEPDPATQPKSCCGEPEHATAGRPSTADGFRYAFGDLLRMVFPWILFGVAAAAVIQLLLPQAVFQGFLSNPWWSLLVMLVISVPLYVCAEGSTPIAAALVAQGVSPGAALVLLLAGPATNVGALGVLRGELGTRAVAVYLLTIVVATLLIGAVFNVAAMQFSGALVDTHHGHGWIPEWVKQGGAVVFLALGLWSLRPRFMQWVQRVVPGRKLNQARA